jgi:hypothetical protein
MVDQITYNGLSLASPTTYTADKPLDADHDSVAHSVRVYKGKVFLLVSFNIFTVAVTHFDIIGAKSTGCGHFADMGRPGAFPGARRRFLRRY